MRLNNSWGKIIRNGKTCRRRLRQRWDIQLDEGTPSNLITEEQTSVVIYVSIHNDNDDDDDDREMVVAMKLLIEKIPSEFG